MMIIIISLYDKISFLYVHIMPSMYVVYSSFTSLKTTSNFIYLKSINTLFNKNVEKQFNDAFNL